MELEGNGSLTNLTSNNWTFAKNLNQSDFENESDEDEILSLFYEAGVPCLMLLSIISFLVNIIILLAILSSKNLIRWRSSDGYLLLITSIVASDTLNSLLLCLGLLCGSYLPVVHGFAPPMCFMLGMECARLAILLTTVLHLLFMVILHTAGICAPLRLKSCLTPTVIMLVIILLWIIPLGALVGAFSSVPDQMFLSQSCSEISILQTFSFRAYFTSAIFTPVILIIFTYSYFYFVLHQRTSLARCGQGIQRQNIRAAGITFLILLSCLLCWVPASVTHLIICPQGCIFSHLDIHPHTGFVLHASITLLLILKSVINPLIFAMRHRQVRYNVIRFLKCKKPRDESLRRRQQRSFTQHTMISRGSTRRCPRYS